MGNILKLGLFVHSKQLDGLTNYMRFQRNTTWFSDLRVASHKKSSLNNQFVSNFVVWKKITTSIRKTCDMAEIVCCKKKQIFATSEALNFDYRSLPGNVCSVPFDERSHQSISYSLVSMKMWVIAWHGVLGLRAQTRNLCGQCLKRFCQRMEGDDNAGLISFQRRVLLEMLDQKQFFHFS